MAGYRPLGGILHGQGIDVSISLSSGFSWQDPVNSVAFSPDGKDTMFPSRNRAAFHVRATQSRMYHPWGTSVCFHLVIERLLISGCSCNALWFAAHVFQSRYRAASHFRGCHPSPHVTLYISFNLVIERLLISGCPRGQDTKPGRPNVSISLSSGFSFQGLGASASSAPYA